MSLLETSSWYSVAGCVFEPRCTALMYPSGERDQLRSVCVDIKMCPEFIYAQPPSSFSCDRIKKWLHVPLFNKRELEMNEAAK